MAVPPARRSSCVTLTLVSAAAAGSLALFSYGCSRHEEENVPAEVVSTEQTYTNNHYVPGAGYYHAPFRMWFPLRYNEYQPGNGYYYNGGWHPRPDQSPVTSSKPAPEGVSRVNSLWRDANPDAARRTRSGSSHAGSSRSGFSWSTKSSASSTSSTRGGFGRGGGFSSGS